MCSEVENVSVVEQVGFTVDFPQKFEGLSHCIGKVHRYYNQLLNWSDEGEQKALMEKTTNLYNVPTTKRSTHTLSFLSWRKIFDIKLLL